MVVFTQKTNGGVKRSPAEILLVGVNNTIVLNHPIKVACTINHIDYNASLI